MNEKYINLFNGYRRAYGVADWANVKIDPVSGKRNQTIGGLLKNLQTKSMRTI